MKRFFTPRYKYGVITKKWGDTKFKKEFDDVLDNWLKQFEKTDRKILLELLDNFYYYTEAVVKQKVVALHERFNIIHGNDLSKVVFAKLPKEYGVANSDFIFMSYWFYNDIKSYSSNDIIREFLQNNAIPAELVIIDDYIGSGESIIEAFSNMLSIAPELHNSKLYVLVVHSTVLGLQNIEEFKNKLGLDLNVVYLECSDKAFKEDYIFDKIEANEKQEDFKSISKGKNVSENVILGYKDTQSLVSFEKTTPNNTLGLFWHKADGFEALFRKNITFRNASISELKGIARKNGYRQPVLFNIADNEYNRFIVYCILNGNDFSVEKACADFGIDVDILQKRLKYIAEKGYVFIQDGRILPTDEIQTKIIKKRLKGWATAEQDLMNVKKIPLTETKYVPKNFSKSFGGYSK